MRMNFQLMTYFVNEFEKACSKLRDKLSTYGNLLYFRTENNESNFSVDNLFEIIIKDLSNEDDYGLVFGLSFRKDLIDGKVPIELSVIRGTGRYLKAFDFAIQSDIDRKHFEPESLISALEECSSVILISLRDYLGSEAGG